MAPSGRIGEQVEIGSHQIGAVGDGVFADVAAEYDDVMIRAAIEQAMRLRQVGGRRRCPTWDCQGIVAEPPWRRITA